MFKTGQNLRSILTKKKKSELPINSYPGVYSVPCNCGNNYIGHTGKRVLTRINEHKKAVNFGYLNDSALAEHTEHCLEGIKWNETKTISMQSNYFTRTIREALEIQKEEICSGQTNIINDRAGLHVTTETWKPFFAKFKKEKL